MFVIFIIIIILAIAIKLEINMLQIINYFTTLDNMHLTRKTGGAKLGEGSKGIVYDTISPEDEDSFYSILKSYEDDIVKIILFSQDGEYTLGKRDIQPFIDYIKITKNTVAKIIKSRAKKRSTKKISHFKVRIDDEVRSNLKIMEKFGSYSKRYLTVKPDLIFDKVQFFSCKIIYNSNKEPTYVIFGEKCTIDKKVNLDRLINDILECLKITERKAIYHNDIKMENIMYCDNTYKLIDWGNATFSSIQRGGLFMGPLKKYLTGYSLKEARNDLNIKIEKHYPSLYRSEIYKHTHARILAEFDGLLENNDREDLLKNFKGNHDLFSFGLTILQIVEKEKLDYNKYSRIITMLTSYINPITAVDAFKDVVNE
jgi:serine/threonine protein kinase